MAGAPFTAIPPLPIARFSVEQYHRMLESGAFTEDDRLELIEGWVVQQLAKGPGHEYAVGQGEELLRACVPTGWHVRNQAPITLASSEPEPDLAIVRGDRGAYRRRHPAASDVALVVEVSDTSLDTDRIKGKTYGAAGIAQYWIVNLVDRCVEAYAQPDPASEAGYARRALFRANETIPLHIAGQDLGTLAVVALLP
ncbi:MAG TPA: Uma2 family endonuclease [Kofleriaceae bacterium]|nr:Uma2 family endonuclease [Kofleriaceae bacterium]